MNDFIEASKYNLEEYVKIKDQLEKSGRSDPSKIFFITLVLQENIDIEKSKTEKKLRKFNSTKNYFKIINTKVEPLINDFRDLNLKLLKNQKNK